MKDEDLDRCPRCKEDMWAGNKLCRNCQREEDLEEWPGGDGYPFDDGKEPPVHAHMEAFGGKVVAVSFRDALEDADFDEDEDG